MSCHSWCRIIINVRFPKNICIASIFSIYFLIIFIIFFSKWLVKSSISSIRSSTGCGTFVCSTRACLSPMSSWLASIHFRKHKSQDSFSILPIKISQFNLFLFLHYTLSMLTFVILSSSISGCLSWIN